MPMQDESLQPLSEAEQIDLANIINAIKGPVRFSCDYTNWRGEKATRRLEMQEFYYVSESMTDLDQLIAASVERVRQMSPSKRAEMRQAQLRSYLRAEAAFGSDADEAAYVRALAMGDEVEIARLDAEAAARVAAAEEHLNSMERP